MKPLAFRRSLQEVPKGPEPPKDRRRKAAVWAAAKVGFSRLSVFVSPEPIAFRRWTFSILPPGRRLRLNVRTRRGGSVLVEVADLDGKPVAGRSFSEATPIFGDHHHTAVHWGEQEDLGHPEGSPIFFRFRMNRAQIFGLEFS